MSSLSSILGISPKDFEIFAFLSSKNALPASAIALQMGINRTTIFSALKRLQNKGLVFGIPQKGTTFFSGVDPENLVTLAKRRIEKEEENLWHISEFAKNLQLKKTSPLSGPQTAFFEGEEGIIALFKKMLLKDVSQEVFLTLEKIPLKVLSFLKKEFITEKKAKNVFSRILIPYSSRAEKYQKRDEKENRQTRFVPEHTAFETEIILSGSSIALIDYRENGLGVFIESAPLANTLRATFEMLWK